MANNKLAIIGGSGLYDIEELKDREFLDLNTPWGKPSDQILKTKFNKKEVFFLPRHGRGHFISPSKINFRANIDALKQLGVTDIISVSAVGSLKEELKEKISTDSAALTPKLENFAQMYQQMAAGLLNMSLDKLIPPGHPMYSKENSITLLKEEKQKILKENLELKKKLEDKK